MINLVELVGKDRPSTFHIPRIIQRTPANQLKTVIKNRSSGFESAIAGALTFPCCPKNQKDSRLLANASCRWQN